MYRLDEFSVFLESSFVLDIVRRHPSLNLVSQSLWKYRKTLNFKLAAKRIRNCTGYFWTEFVWIQRRQNNNKRLSFTQTCSFLISFLRSASYFSFWFAFVALWTWKNTSQFLARYKLSKGELNVLRIASHWNFLTCNFAKYLLPDVFKCFYTFLNFLKTTVNFTWYYKSSIGKGSSTQQ